MFDAADALLILTKIRTFHGQQDIGTSVCESWAEALNVAGVTSIEDARMAVVKHYSTPGCNPWITPGDVVAGVRAIRDVRVKDINDGDLTPDLPYDTPVGDYLETLRSRYSAVRDGMPVRTAIATVKPIAAIGGRR